MQKRNIEKQFYQSCLRKANLSEEKANKIIDLHLETDKKLLYYYKCPFCNSFHLTSKEPLKEIELRIV